MTEQIKWTIIESMVTSTMEKHQEYTVRIRLKDQEAKRFESYVSHTGMKKYAVVQKALIKYLEEQQAEN